MVNQNRLMKLISITVDDGDVISLIRKYLVSGVQINDGYKETIIGTPQGGNLSPLLSNIMVNALDKELVSRGLRVVRYADAWTMIVQSELAARRVMRSVTKDTQEQIGLLVNTTKSKI